MAVYEVELMHRQEIASETMAFHFHKPEGFLFKPGQFCELTLINPPRTDDEGNSRAFTLASAPHESDLMVATRMRDSAFKQNLKTMELGTKLKLDAPYGSFTLHGDTEIPAVFLAGGIGVTPARSIILQAAKDMLGQAITLFYSNRRPEDAAFLEELDKAQRENPNFNLVATMTEIKQSKTDWNGETGHIDGAMIEKSITGLSRPIYYISGPQAMVDAMRELLEKLGVKDHMIRAEEFPGY